MAFVEIVEAMERAHLHDFVRRLMIAREHVDFVAAAFENLAVAVDAFVPGTLIAGGEVEVGFRREQFLEPLPIVVDVGKEEELHGLRRSSSSSMASAAARALCQGKSCSAPSE